MANKSITGLISYCKAQVGRPYWYGSHGQIADAALYKSLKKTYPSYYTASDFASQYGLKVHDCSGLVKGYMWSDDADSAAGYVASQDVNSAGMYSGASTKGAISTFPKTNGTLVFRTSVSGNASKIHHVGVYCTDGYVYEAKGHAYGVRKTAYAQSEWDYWAEYKELDYGKVGATSGTTSSKADVLEVAYQVINGEWGVQPDREKKLEAAGYDYKTVQAKVNEILGTTKKTTTPTYTTGKVYTTQVNHLAVRTGAGTSYKKKTRSQLTKDGRAHAYSDGCLESGTNVTVKQVKTVGSDIWVKIPSGWVAAYYQGNIYVK